MVSKTQERHLLRRFYPGINARVTAPFLVTIVVIAGIGVYIVTQLVAGSLQERFSNQLMESSQAANNSVVMVEEELLSALRLMVYTNGVPEAIETQNIDDLVRWLRPITINAHLDDVIVFNRTGQGILNLTKKDSNYEDVTPPDVSGWMSVGQALLLDSDAQGDKFAELVRTSDQIYFYIVAPVRGADGGVVGGISVGMDVDNLATIVSSQAVSSIVFLDSTGQVLGHTFPGTDVSLAVSQAHMGELSVQMHYTSPVDKVALGGTPYQILYSPLRLRSQQIGLIGVGLPTNYIVERISTSRDRLSLLFAVLFVTVALLGLVAAHTITGPIRRLVDTTRAIRGGDLSKRVGLHTPDELGELATSFDHMTNQLVERNAQVESLYLQQLEETARREAVLSSIGDAVLVINPKGRIILKNESATRLLETLETAPRIYESFKQLCLHAELLAEPRMFTLDNCYFNVLATPVLLRDNTLLGHVIVFHDITALIQSEELKDQLILQMSHELRTPLTAARGYVDLVGMLEGQRLSEAGGSYVSKATESLSSLERMINQVIDVSAIISNRFSVSHSQFNLSILLRKTVRDWQDASAQRNLSLDLTLPSDDIWIEGDEHYLGQVFEHLIRNAWSYTLPGGSVEVYGSIQDSKATIYVTDSGTGIAPDEVERVFDRMYRGRSADAGPTDARGLGLGLYLSKHIVEAHHGSILLESKVNYGTVVTVALPVDGHG
ncbi:MAG TPA: ATP-binding protein [Oculatellaceae cyanobacterium]|nr:ATP-binding protein [Aggregatilineaceae bacterium]